MADFDNRDRRLNVIDFKNDPEVTMPNAVFLSRSGQLLNAGWSRFAAERRNPLNDSLPILFSDDALELFDRGLFDEDAITCHDASSSAQHLQM